MILRNNKQKRKCAVYGTNLSRAGKLVLARQHDEFNQIQQTTSFPEMPACCQRILFAHFSPDSADDGTFSPDIPRYNTQEYWKFKLECLTYLVSSQIVSKVGIYTVYIIITGALILKTGAFILVTDRRAVSILVTTPQAGEKRFWIDVLRTHIHCYSNNMFCFTGKGVSEDEGFVCEGTPCCLKVNGWAYHQVLPQDILETVRLYVHNPKEYEVSQ